MRLWSLHPKYLDPQGLVALWREALLANAVLRGETQGYLNHPQLERFQSQAAPLSAISEYLLGVHAEAVSRGYAFDRSKIGCVSTLSVIPVTSSQMEFEWQHLLKKLSLRSPDLYQRWRKHDAPSCHPLFRVQPGPCRTVGAFAISASSLTPSTFQAFDLHSYSNKLQVQFLKTAISKVRTRVISITPKNAAPIPHL